MRELHIYDVMPFIHVGSKTQSGSKTKYYGFPTGGLEKLMTAVMASMEKENADVILAFDSPTDRKDYIPSYKADRVSEPNIYMQATVLYPALTKIGFHAFKFPDLEADDIIAKAVSDNYSKYTRIVVKTNDMDLAANIDGLGKVRIESPSTISYNVERRTYEEVLSNTSSAKDVLRRYVNKTLEIDPMPDIQNTTFHLVNPNAHMVVPFNSITPFKVFLGDKSDNIPAFPGVDNPYQLFLDFLIYIAQDLKQDVSTLSQAHNAIQYYEDNPHNLTDKQLEELANRINVFYPRLVEHDLTYNRAHKISVDKLIDFGNSFGLSFIPKMYKKPFRTTPQQINWLKDMAFKIDSGKVSSELEMPVTGVENTVDEKATNADVYMGSNVGSF